MWRRANGFLTIADLLYFFRYWEYDKSILLSTGSVSMYGVSRLTKLNAVFTFERTPLTYLFQGTQYWRYNEKAKRATGRYPRNISPAWPNVVNNLDAAMTWINKKSYIFKGEDYYKIEASRRRRGRITVVNGYPRSIAEVWMRCSSS